MRLDQFERAFSEISAHGDNDTLPFDVDNLFLAQNKQHLASVAYNFSQELADLESRSVAKRISSIPVFAERLLVPAGPAGFRITTKIHPFWNAYLNGLGIAIAEALEPSRSNRVHSYRFVQNGGDDLFSRDGTWKAFRRASIEDCEALAPAAVVVQTDIASFYEHVSHHRIENCIDALFQERSGISAQVDRFLSKFAAGRSFGLPVGGQCSRVLAELLLSSVDGQLSDAGIIWRRYVDDFVLVAASQSDAYRALSILSHSLDWNSSLSVAVERQRKYFKAKRPDELSAVDKSVASHVANNLIKMLRRIQSERGGATIICGPSIPGYQWIASGIGDFALAATLVEVKCTHKNFSLSDYRQLLIYWILSCLASVEAGTPEWREGFLVNPRLNLVVGVPFAEVSRIVCGGRSKVELLAYFSGMISNRELNVAQ